MHGFLYPILHVLSFLHVSVWGNSFLIPSENIVCELSITASVIITWKQIHHNVIFIYRHGISIDPFFPSL